MERSPAEQLIVGQGNLLRELSELGADVDYQAIERMMEKERQKMFHDKKVRQGLALTALEIEQSW